MSPAIEVDTDVFPPNISSLSGDNYNDESKLAMERIVQDWIDHQPKDTSTQYSEDDLRKEDVITDSVDNNANNFDYLCENVLETMIKFFSGIQKIQKQSSLSNSSIKRMISMISTLFEDNNVEDNDTQANPIADNTLLLIHLPLKNLYLKPARLLKVPNKRLRLIGMRLS
jgi:hypothetical protein